ncbi:MAG: energy transducer TonB [Bacteroidales bacterium]|nr:energy transducer TonB [Bacteroidales bacterium]
MKNILGIFVFLLLIWNCFPQLNIIDPKATTPKATTSQSQIISVNLPFTSFEGNNNLVDNYLCYNGEQYYILAKKTSSPSVKNVSFVLGTTKESSIKTLRDLQDWMSNNPIKTSITVNMGGKKHTITKTDEDILSFTSPDNTVNWMLDSHQITKSINHLSSNGFSNTDQSSMYRGRGGTGSGGGSGSGIGSGLGPGTGSGIGSGEGSGLGPGHGGGIGYGTGSREMINTINTTVNTEGQVCVEVHVTEEGNVISARVINTSKFRTTINNSAIQAQCIAQAKQARYKPGKEELRVIIFK